MADGRPGATAEASGYNPGEPLADAGSPLTCARESNCQLPGCGRARRFLPDEVRL